VADLLARGAVYVWPGCGEAYGLAYLEAQAAGVPVVAQAVAGVPEVVAHGATGFLVAEGDDRAAAQAIARLLTDGALQRQMGQAARAHVATHHAMVGAAGRLDALLRRVTG
jgi:glycosyltransferase involved in cell wall biosynthesis